MDEPRPPAGRVRRMGRLTPPAADGLLTYGEYLRVPELLSLQVLRSDPPAHDEHLFIVVHQAYELWFKEIVVELEAARERMFAGDGERARHYLRRVHAIERVLLEQIEVLETMTPQDFLAFRASLAPASGFQSAQFREIECLSGLKDPRHLADVETSPEERDRLARRLAEPTLWDAFVAFLEARGLPMPPGDADARRRSLLRMARDPAFADAFALAEALLDHDEAFALWRYRHVLMVEREIGAKRGTGGSSGVAYLRTTLDRRFFPELWDLRSHL
ncbi:MAG TPA: tryptophan 2,3-dioxygenase family protein [Actinomycetota bacterium]|nr:tryptophan 2,3-dioxygenase family protein [Actinomycetota bacterium]